MLPEMAGRRMGTDVAWNLRYKFLHTLLRSNKVCAYLFNSLKMLVPATSPHDLFAQRPDFALS